MNVTATIGVKMTDALYDALYVKPAAFQWVHFTKHGVVRGAMSLACHGWNPIQPYPVNNHYTDWVKKK